MKFSTVCQLALATIATAAPAASPEVQTVPTANDLKLFESARNQARAAGLTDVDILNFALTLEHLEKAFYMRGLSKFTASDFTSAGFASPLRTNLMEIYKDESTHVSFLESALKAGGYSAVPACKYAFGSSDPATFMQTASILEGVGVTAYLGAAHLISSGDYLTAAGSILTVEARHNAYIRDNQMPAQSPFPYPFDVPLTPMQVFTLASEFITSCPKSADLGFTAFPSLAAASGTRMPKKAGKPITFDVAKSVDLSGKGVYAYYIGNGGYVPAKIVRKSASMHTVEATTPEGVAGQSYVILSSTGNATDVSDSNTLAGPAIVWIQSPYTGMGALGN